MIDPLPPTGFSGKPVAKIMKGGVRMRNFMYLKQIVEE